MKAISAVLLICVSMAGVAYSKEHTLALRNPRPTVEAAYDELALMSDTQLRNGYGKISPDLRADLWIFHLQRYLDAHPSLPEAERELVLEAIGLVATGLVDLGSNPETADEARAIATRFSERARAVMPIDHIADAFVALGKQPRPAGDTPVHRSKLPNRIVPLCLPGTCQPECDCATGSDWCDGITNPDYICATKPCTPSWGCGLLLLYDCNGVCSTPTR